ncbi:MAG: orotidine-5'-phosphate decarboxylase [bacterium]
MNALKKLQTAQSTNRSLICLGLDLDPRKMPGDYTKSIRGMFDFATRIIEATSDQVCAYKPNLAFYENLGPEGMSLLTQIVKRIPGHIPVILDGKRGDIGNTAIHYAEMLFDKLGGDWVTLSPYMGYDSIRPFIEHKDVGVFILCLTSNPGHKDFQMLMVNGKPLYRVVAEKVAYWNKEDNFGLVVGATAPEQIGEIRIVAGDMPLLIPGVGAQGGSLEQAVTSGTAEFSKTAVINVSRSVLYASRDTDFAERARQELQKLNRQVESLKSGSAAIHPEPAAAPPSAAQASPVPPAPPAQPTPPSEQPPAPASPSETLAVPPEDPAPPSEAVRPNPDHQSNSYNKSE